MNNTPRTDTESVYSSVNGVWMTVVPSTLARQLERELNALYELLPCGHRKIDNEDSYGGCIACTYKNGYHEYEKQIEILETKLASNA